MGQPLDYQYFCAQYQFRGDFEEPDSPIAKVFNRPLEQIGSGEISMKAWLLIAVLAAAPIAAHAESFTFTSTSKTIDYVMLNPASPDGRPQGASVFNSSSKTTAADGKIYISQGKCSSWYLPSGSPLGISGVCHFSDGTAPLYDIAYTCELPSKNAPAIDCWGKLIGTGGAWKGRFGSAAWLSRQDGTNQGTGQWD